MCPFFVTVSQCKIENDPRATNAMSRLTLQFIEVLGSKFYSVI